MTTGADLAALADAAPVVFIGSLYQLAASTVETVPADPLTAVVKVDQTLRMPPGYGALAGRQVTVRLLAPLAIGRYTFFADLLASGGGLAVLERGHLDAAAQGAEAILADALAQGYAARLTPRVAAATVVALATVGAVQSRPTLLAQDDEWEDPEQWATAALVIKRVLKGDPQLRTATLVGLCKPSRRFLRSPVLREGRYAVHLLQPPPEDVANAVPQTLGSNLFFVADTNDIQPPDQLDSLARLVAMAQAG